MPTLRDLDIIDFGKYKGTKMLDVPADYILYMGEQMARTAPNKRTLREAMFVKYYETTKEVLLKQVKEAKEKRKDH
jgi:hypothetical protein